MKELLITQVEAFAEALNTAGRVKDTLLASKEWMALRAHVNLQYGLCTHCLEAVATGALHCGFNIVRMNS